MSADVTTDRAARPVFTRTQVLGLLLMAAGPALSWIIEITFLGAEALSLFASRASG